MNTLAEQERKLLALLANSVHRRFAEARAAGVPVDVFDDIEAIARSMAEALPTIAVYDQLVGPFHDTIGLTQWRGVSRQAINQAVAAGTVIACRLEGDQWVYPTWQFTDSGTVHPHLITLWATLRVAADPWTCAVWLRSPQAELDDRSAADWITDGQPFEAALELARADAERWVGKEAENRAVANDPLVAPAEKKQSNKSVTVYISHEVFSQARLAFTATRTAEGDRNWSSFVEKAIAGEIERRAERHNRGAAFEGFDAPLSPGRPLEDT